MAEGQGFEPWEALTSPVFKTGAFNHSATPPEWRDYTGESAPYKLGRLYPTGPDLARRAAVSWSEVGARYAALPSGSARATLPLENAGVIDD